MPKPKSNKDRYNFLIDKSVYDEFSEICDELGLVRGKQVERFMKEFIEKRKKEVKR